MVFDIGQTQGAFKLTKKTNLNTDNVDSRDYTFIEPFDSNYLPPLYKSTLFIELLRKADESFDYITDAFKSNSDVLIDEAGLVTSTDEDKSRYELKMKPIHDCESFISKHPFTFWDLIFLINQAKQMGVSAQAQVNAYKRLENDTKQKEKAFVFECWKAWRLNPSQYKGNTAFANDMLKKFEQDDPKEQKDHLSSVAVITGWCRDWEKEKSQSAS